MDNETTAPTPSEVRAPQGARVLEVQWQDGSTSRIRHEVLRGFCPCAHCQGHQGPIRWQATVNDLPDSALELSDLDEVGSYALRLSWGDQHNSGLFRFEYLKELGDLEGEPTEAIRAKVFRR